jgi:transcriptional regulator with XRE-family HTH domain
MLSAKVDAARLREIREERELTTTRFAALLSQDLGRTVHPSTISKYENDARQPRPQMFNAMCRVLEVQRGELLLPVKANA